MTAELKRHNGVPTIFLDGKPVFAGYMWGSGATPEAYAEPQTLHCTPRLGCTGTPLTWDGLLRMVRPCPGRESHFDFSTVSQRFGRVIDAIPMLAFTCVCIWRHTANGGATCIPTSASSVPTASATASRLPPRCGAIRPSSSCASMSRTSTPWVWAIASSPIKPARRHRRMVKDRHGVAVWRLFRADASPFPPVATRALPGRCRITARRLADATVTFESAEVPSEAEQHKTYAGSFRDPRKERAVIDYYTCLAELCGGLVGATVRRSKKPATAKRWRVPSSATCWSSPGTALFSAGPG